MRVKNVRLEPGYSRVFPDTTGTTKAPALCCEPGLNVRRLLSENAGGLEPRSD